MGIALGDGVPGVPLTLVTCAVRSSDRLVTGGAVGREQEVVPGAAGQAVEAGTAVEAVVPVAPGQAVVPVAAEDGVVARPGGDLVVAATREDGVVAAEGGDAVGPRGTADDVVAFGPDDRPRPGDRARDDASKMRLVNVTVRLSAETR